MLRRPRHVTVGRIELLTMALSTLCLADMDAGGYATWPALGALGISLLLLVAAMSYHRRLAPGHLPWIAGPFLVLLMMVRFGVTFPLALWPSILLTVLVVVSSLDCFGQESRRFWCTALVLAWVGILVIWINVVPIHIDVISILRDGSLRLLRGQDPYSGSYPSTTAGATALPYTYSPATAILAAPAAWIGNVRYSNLALGVTIAWALYRLGLRGAARVSHQSRTRLLPLILAVPLMTPMVWAGWTEVYVLAPFLLWLLWRGSHPRVAMGCLAVALGAKYTILPVLVPLYLWSPKMRKDIVRAGTVSVLIFYLPFILWAGPARFFHDTIGIFISLPAIPHSLALQSLLAYFGVPGPTVAVTGAVLAAALGGLVFWRPNDLSDLLLASSAFAFLAILVNRWAFFNYWALVAYVLLAALLTTGTAEAVALPRWIAVSRRLNSAIVGTVSDPS